MLFLLQPIRVIFNLPLILIWSRVGMRVLSPLSYPHLESLSSMRTKIGCRWLLYPTRTSICRPKWATLSTYFVVCNAGHNELDVVSLSKNDDGIQFTSPASNLKESIPISDLKVSRRFWKKNIKRFYCLQTNLKVLSYYPNLSHITNYWLVCSKRII
jgi:hypothetical protein